MHGLVKFFVVQTVISRRSKHCVKQMHSLVIIINVHAVISNFSPCIELGRPG